MTPREYREYIASVEWKYKRVLKLMEMHYTCEHKGNGECSGILVVHHKTYAHFMYEPMADLNVLCRRHHSLEHQENRVKQTNFDFRRDEELPQAIENKIDELNREASEIYDQLKTLLDVQGYNELSAEQIDTLKSIGFGDYVS